ncbi:MAG: transcriptional repressor, partial [Muribaculaceae bacterium]|nr:transcriptional repressor [Muribaculaceae bacterium]
MCAVYIPDTASAEHFADFLRRTSRRCTPERFMILDVVQRTRGHFTVRDVASTLSQKGYPVTKTTIYSTLQYLVECGLCRRLNVDTVVRFEFVQSGDHHHLVCLRCGRIRDVKVDDIPAGQTSEPALADVLRSRRYTSFTPSYFSLTVYGICSAVARKARRTGNKPAAENS